MKLSEKTIKFIIKQDQTLNKMSGWEKNDIQYYVRKLLSFGTVEVGWRECCGYTDPTSKIYDRWVKVVKKMRKDGIKINEERQKHGNAYASNNGGFWDSIVYSTIPDKV